MKILFINLLLFLLFIQIKKCSKSTETFIIKNKKIKIFFDSQIYIDLAFYA
ncbi:hypothetical protein ACINWCA92_A0015 [Acinetobacter baumannii WC-A-92]|nr:hypothetical protein ACINWCA92_A0015 [Acinetobacter baumannii WC-A-92]